MRPAYAGMPLGGLDAPTHVRGVAARGARCGAWTSRQLALALGAVGAFWLAAALVWPLSGAVVPWDSKNHFYPMFRYLSDALAHGELPLWNPYHFSGHPTAADPQSMLFTPTMLFFAWAMPQPSMQVFDLVVFAHLLPGALALPFIFRRRGWHSVGAVVAAMIFVLGGSAAARLQHTGIIFGYGLYPLAFLILEETLERASYAFAAAFAVVASVMVIGRDQVAFLCALSLVALVICAIVQSGAPLAYLRRRAGPLALAGLLGAAILAVPVLLTLQFLGTSTRPSFGFGVAAMGSLPPESLATILFANVFGSLRWTYDYWGPDWHSLAEGTWTDRATNYLFVGTIPALLVVWHGIAGRRLLAREFRFFLVFGVLVLVYALGRYTPVFSVIFDSLPGVSLYRRPADATFLINIVLAFAGGYLVHRFIADGAPRLTASRNSVGAALPSAIAVALVVAAIGAGFAFAVPAGQAGRAALEIGATILASVLAIWLLRRATLAPQMRVALAALLVAATGAELIWRNAASALNAEPAARYAVFETLPPDQARGLQILRTELAARHAKGEHPRVEILGLTGGWQNASMVLGLEDTIGYNPLRLADYERAIGPGENAADPNLRQFPGTFRGYKCRLAGLLGLEYLVLDRPAERLPRHFPRLSGTKLLYGAGSMWIYELNPGSPRAYLASHVRPVESEQVLQLEELPDFDRRNTALVDTDQADHLRFKSLVGEPETENEAPVGNVKVREYRPNEVVLDVDTRKPGIVVLHDIHYPGWEVSVDGQPGTLLRANLLFRGVEVDAGRHVVTFRFRPLSPANLLAAATEVLDRETVTR